jgi:hypothetical protein
LFRFNKIPFTCTYLPGKMNLKVTFGLCWVAFTTYSWTMAEFELDLLHSPGHILVLCFYCVAAVAVAAWFLRPRKDGPPTREIIFEDNPAGMLQALDLER